MSRTVVCYIERVAGGSLIARVRLVADGGPMGVDRSWTAPSFLGGGSAASGSSEGGGGGGAGGVQGAAAPAASEAVTHARTAARWVADSLGSLGTRRLAMVCVDPDGSVCTWLSAPSADPEVIEATLMQPDNDVDAAGGGGGVGGGAARLLALGAGSVAGGGWGGYSPGDASVQALATLEHPSEKRMLPGKKARPSATGVRSRFAVLAVPDAPVRVFLDELDARNVEVDQVVSLWHALAMAWDPGAPGSTDDLDSPAGERVVASVSPAAAVVAVDPIGRLVWVWSQSGQLVAGGTMRLRSVHAQSSRPAEPSSEIAEPGAARRIGVETENDSTVEFTGSDAGRLTLDWLSWSAQLGHCPQRVACIGPAPMPAAGGGADAAPPTPDAGLIGRSIGELWPGASVGVAIHADPIGATLQRLLTRDIAQAHRAAADLSVATGSDDPRGSLVGLSARAGKVDRRMYTWMAIGVAAMAAVVCVLGWQFHHASGKGDAAIAEAAQARKDAIDSLKESNPTIAVNPKVELESEITKLKAQDLAIKPPRPLLQEMEKVLNIISEHQDVKVERFTINQTNSTATLLVPDADTGPDILEKIQKVPNLYMNWTGNVLTGFGAMNPGERKYTLNGFQSEAGARAGAGGGR